MDVISSLFCCADDVDNTRSNSDKSRNMPVQRTGTKERTVRTHPKGRDVVYKEQNTDSTGSSSSSPKVANEKVSKKETRVNNTDSKKHMHNNNTNNTNKTNNTNNNAIQNHNNKRNSNNTDKKQGTRAMNGNSLDEIKKDEDEEEMVLEDDFSSVENNNNKKRERRKTKQKQDIETQNRNENGSEKQNVQVPNPTKEEQELVDQFDNGTKLSKQNSVSSENSDENYDSVPTYDEEEIEEEYIDLTVLQPGQYHAPGYETLLSPKTEEFKNKKCLVLDLDETLVHSSFKYLQTADFVLPVDIDNQIHNVYVIKRPGVDEFLKRVGKIYEVVVFTASVNRYGDPLLDILDKSSSIHHRLFRDACYTYEGNYIKNLSQIGRPLNEIIILDNSPPSYIFHPQHAIPISSWFSDTHDNELLDILPLLEDLAQPSLADIGKVLDVTI